MGLCRCTICRLYNLHFVIFDSKQDEIKSHATYMYEWNAKLIIQASSHPGIHSLLSIQNICFRETLIAQLTNLNHHQSNKFTTHYTDQDEPQNCTTDLNFLAILLHKWFGFSLRTRCFKRKRFHKLQLFSDTLAMFQKSPLFRLMWL